MQSSGPQLFSLYSSLCVATSYSYPNQESKAKQNHWGIMSSKNAETPNVLLMMLARAIPGLVSHIPSHIPR